MTRLLGVLLATFACPALAAPKLACTQDGTRAYFCIDEAAVRSGIGKHSDLRASRLYTGTPQSVSDAKMNLIVSCPTRIAVLQDLRGINIGGGKTGDTDVLRTLSKWVCDQPKPKPDAKLRQFGPD